MYCEGVISVAMGGHGEVCTYSAAVWEEKPGGYSVGGIGCEDGGGT